MVSPMAASSIAASAVWPNDAAKRVLTVSPTTARPIATKPEHQRQNDAAGAAPDRAPRP